MRMIRQHWPWFAVLWLVALAVRIVPYWAEVLSPGGILIADPDAAYHLRRVQLIQQQFPAFPFFDPYLHHPHGAAIIWPPLYDAALALVHSLATLIPGLPSPLHLLVFLPAVLSAALCTVVFATALRVADGRAGIAFLAALVPAAAPSIVTYSYLSHLDHHAAEFLMIALFLHALITGATDEALDGSILRRHRRGILAGGILGVAVMVQLGLMVLSAIPVAVTLASPRRNWKGGAEGLALLFAVAALSTLFPALASQWSGVPFAHTHLSLFHPALFLGAAAGAAAAATFLHQSPRTARQLASAGGLALVAVLAAAMLGREVLEGASYITTGWSGWQKHISESLSLLSLPLKEAGKLLARQETVIVFLLPIAWWAIVRRWKERNPSDGVLLVSSILFAGMGLQQLRYLPYLALITGILAIRAFLHFPALARRRGTIAVFSGGMVVALAWPLSSTAETIRPLFRLAREIKPVIETLRELPDSSGVIAEWSLGHYIQYFGDRPSVADNFGEHVGGRREVRSFLLATSNEKAYRMLDSLKVRYVLCRGLAGTLSSILEPDESSRYLSGARAGEDATHLSFAPELFPTVLYRLVWRYGSAAADPTGLYHPPLDRLRLISESGSRDEEIPAPMDLAEIKLFELVPGAKVRISDLPANSQITLIGMIQTPRGRRFPYLALGRSDNAGQADLVLPYATEPSPRAAHVVRYSLQVGGFAKQLPGLSEEAVVSGDTVRVRWSTLR